MAVSLRAPCRTLVNMLCLPAQIAEDPDTYSDFFHMRRGEGDHVYCVLVRGIRCQPQDPRPVTHIMLQQLVLARYCAERELMPCCCRMGRC